MKYACKIIELYVRNTLIDLEVCLHFDYNRSVYFIRTVLQSPVTTPTTSRRKEVLESRSKMNSDESIRDNVKKSLQEQMAIRMAETEGSKFTDEEIKQFAIDTEAELHDLFRDVGMKYKAKYRSLIFNIKDRKNLTLWEKICDKSLTPKQLVS